MGWYCDKCNTFNGKGKRVCKTCLTVKPKVDESVGKKHNRIKPICMDCHKPLVLKESVNAGYCITCRERKAFAAKYPSRFTNTAH